MAGGADFGAAPFRFEPHRVASADSPPWGCNMILDAAGRVSCHALCGLTAWHCVATPVRSRMAAGLVSVGQVTCSERFVRSIKHECLGRIVPIGERHLRASIDHHKRERPHQELDNELLAPSSVPATDDGTVVCDEQLGGLIRSYLPRPRFRRFSFERPMPSFSQICQRARPPCSTGCRRHKPRPTGVGRIFGPAGICYHGDPASLMAR